MPFFSTIIAVHNRQDLIASTLESVLNQSFDDQQVIVVDDGSTDETRDVLKKFEPQITVISQENQGPGAARNAGIEVASGEYITLIDSDDLWFPWTLATYHKAITKNDNPSFVASIEWDFHHESDLKIVRQQSYDAVAYDDYYASASDQRWVPLCGVAINTKSLRRVGGFPADRFNYEESDVWLRLGMEPGFVRITNPRCSARRKHPGMITHDLSRSVQGLQRLIDRETKHEYPGGPARHLQRIELITRHVRSLCAQCIKQGDKASARSLYQQTRKWHWQLGRYKFLLGVPWLLWTTPERGGGKR